MPTSHQPPLSLYDRSVAIAAQGDELAHALAQSEERYQHLVQRVVVGVFRVSSDGRIVEANPAVLRMLGYAHESEIQALEIGRDVFVQAVEFERLRSRLDRGVVDRTSVRWKRKDGSCLTVRLSLRSVHDEHERLIYYDGFVDDVTERMRQQELLRRTERMACLGATLAGVAHELNNPLAAILGFAQLLLKKAVDPESRLALETIDHEASRAGKIVRELLTLARKREVERRVRVNLNEVVAYIVGTRRYALETHGIGCVATLDPHLPQVVGDRTQLEQVVLNLLNNAEQAIRTTREEGGQIQIRTRGEGASALLEIEDDGPGVPDDARDRIWDPFWTTKGLGDGTGLGLTVVRDIIASHGGEITIAPPVGRAAVEGARFIVRLPGIYLRASLATDELNEAASQALDVLVIDPDVQSASFLTAFLASRGHAALAAHDVEHAMRLADHLTFDAVVCDSSVAQGNAVFAALRSAAGCVDARFIVAAGDANSTARLPFPLPASTALVMRPYDLEELRVLLED
jgi:PAS domain S-box-containing protein